MYGCCFTLSRSQFLSSILFFLLIYVFASVPNSYWCKVDEQHPSKSCHDHLYNQSCGDSVDVLYPFGIEDRHNSCGLPGFDLKCRNDSNGVAYTTIDLDSRTFRVLKINSLSYIMTVAPIYLWAQTNCTRDVFKRSFNLSGSNFRLCPEVKNFTFYYGCTPHTHDLLALNNLTYLFYGNGSFNYTSGYSNLSEVLGCQGKTEVLVNGTIFHGLQHLNRDKMQELLQKGFLVRYTSNSSSPACSPGSQPIKAVNKVDVKRKIIIGISVAGGTILVMCLLFYLYLQRFKKRFAASSSISRDTSSYPCSSKDVEKAGAYLGVHIFTYSELEEATGNFDSEKELGDGGFGSVYKGKLQDGRDVAVKRLYENNYKRLEQFMNEVKILTRLRHHNLVTLYGCTSHHCGKLLLVYEYIPNGTVADHLHGNRAKPGSVSWKTRLNIAVETASALAYLHASDVVHRDVKTNNILLDNNFCVKVADFGLSRLFPTDATYVSTAPQGTPGYVDPEYHQFYQLTNKSDVFSFGVVLVELISSKPAVDITRHRHEINLSNLAISKIQSCELHELVDPCLGFDSDYCTRRMITDVAELAFLCLQHCKEMRPHMSEVLEGLSRIQSKDYNMEKAEAIPADYIVLLKKEPQRLSPTSVTADWVSSG